MHGQRRRKKRHTHGLKAVDITRGKSGYGFTISGQQPCILSCIVSGSPADCAGLKTGDYLISVNALNVSTASHDDVVSLIGSSTGLLTLQIAENCNDSDSSDDEYNNKPKSKYPNRARLRGQTRGGDAVRPAKNSGGKYPVPSRSTGQLRTRALSPENTRSREIAVFGPPEPRSRSANRADARDRLQGNENLDPLSVAVYPRKQKTYGHPGSGSGEGMHHMARHTQHQVKQASVTRDLRMGRTQPFFEERTPVDRPVLHPHQQQSSSYGRMTPIDLSNILYPSIQPQYHETVTPQEDDFFSDDNSDPCLRVVVGYIGSIEMPRDANLPSARLQSIRSAVRRLRVENRIHTLVMMDVYVGGIRLTNTMGSTVAHYPGEKVAFSGVCHDDKRFFGIVTLHSASSDEISSDASSPQDDWAGSSSCHVFMVDPELRVHSVHSQKARSFGIQCTLDPQTQRCSEFPKSPAPILRSVAKLYRERAGVLRGAPGGNHPRSSSNTSSNSDSGLGIGGGGSGGRDEPDRVYVVEMGNSVSSTSSTSFRWESTEDKSAFYTPPSSLQQTSGSDMSNMSNLRFPSANASGASSGIDGMMHPNSSVSSTDSFLDRLNLRAMPDPKGFMSSISSNTSLEPHDELDTQNSAENIRRNMHKVMSTRQRHLENDDKHRPSSCPGEHVSGSDVDSFRSSESSQNPNPTIRTLHEKQVSAPADTSMPTKLPGPPALPPKSTHMNGSSYSLTGSAHLNVSSSSISSERTSSIIPVPGPIPQPAIAGNGDKLSPRVFAGFNLGLGMPKKNPVPVSIPSVPAPRLMKDPDGFLRPKTPASVKPPVPERKPYGSRGNQRTPLGPPRPSFYDRPKSTPPTLNPSAHQNYHPGEDTEYDSDPGNVGNLSSMSATMSLETTLGGANVSNLSVTGLGEQWAVTGDQWGKPMVDIETPKEKRRFSEGFSLFNKKKDEPDDGNAGGGGGIGGFIEKKKLTKTGSFKYLRPKRNRPTISSSHESLVVSEAEFGNKKQALESARSVVNITGQNGSVQNGTVPHHDEGRRAASWALSFDKMLSDPAGLATFTVFLEKEYSQENIEFWSKCEDYKKIVDAQQRKTVAKDLFEKHLSPHASEAVNVDSHARQVTQAGLEAAASDLFDVAQTQIFQLMKQDSYQRFLKSTLYTKDCVTAELEGRPLPYGPKPQPYEKALKKSTSTSSTSSVTGEEKRRKSLINKMPAPWNRKLEKNRVITKVTTDPDLQKFRRIDGETVHKISTIAANRRSSLDLADLNYMSKEVTAAKEEKKKDESSDSLNSKESHKFCRVILPDNSTTVIPAKTGLTVRASLQKLCERRHISLAAIDVFQVGSDKPLDLGKDISTLASKEIRLEHRILFRLDLPNRKPIGVKAKPGKTVKDVFKPILNKYGCKIDNMVVHMAGTGMVIDIESNVDTLENQRVAVQNSDEFAAYKFQKESQKEPSAKWGGFGSHRSVFGKPPIPKGGRPSLASNSGDTADDATNQMLRELIDGDGVQQFDELGILDPEKKAEEKGKNEEQRNSGIFGFIRRNSIGDKEKNKKQRFPSQRGTSQTSSTTSNEGRPVVPKRNKPKDADEDQFFALLSKVQSHNLDDQRGVMSTKNLELPDFLKPAQNSPQRDSRGRTHMRRNSDSSVMEMMTDDHRIPRPASSDKVDNPADRTINPVDQSFSQDGIMPSHGDAENYFANARNFPGSPNMSINWRESGIGLKDPFSADGASNQTFKSNTPISKLPYRLSPRAKTPTGKQESRAKPMEHTTTESTRVRQTTNISGERATVVVSRYSVQKQNDKASLPPPPTTATKDLTHVGMANFAPPTPIGHQSRSPGRPSVAQQILGANRSVHRSRDSGQVPRSESVPPSNRVSMHRSEAHIQITSDTSRNRHNDSNVSTSSSSYYHSQNSSGLSHHGHSGILTNHYQQHRNERLNDSRHFNHVRFNDHTQTQSYVEVSGTDEETPMITSPASTPSPTTHDLIIDTSPDTTEGGRRLAPRAAKRTVGSPGFSQSDEVKKALSFDAAEANNSDNDMQVSYV